MAKTVLITGASRGIGKATALLFQKNGWQVAATMRNPDQAKDLVSLPNLMCVALDVMQGASIDKAIQSTVKQFGRIDALVNNAGYAATGPFEAASEEQIKRQFEVNVFGLMRMSQKILPLFRQQKDGVIINISSIAGRMTFPWYSLYNATKWTVEGFSEALSHELKLFNIRVKLVEPGIIKTDFYNDSMDRIQNPNCTAYDEPFQRYAERVNQSLAMAATPEQVANVIFRAATDSNSKLRYPAAGGAPLLLTLRKLLPDFIFLPLVRLMTSGK